MLQRTVTVSELAGQVFLGDSRRQRAITAMATIAVGDTIVVSIAAVSVTVVRMNSS